MKWSISLVLALCLVTPALAGEEPYISIVGNDEDVKNFYISPDYKQFMYGQEALGVPVCDGTFPGADNGYDEGCEQFRSQNPQNAPEVCYFAANGEPPTIGLVSPNALTPKGYPGWYEWYVRLPMNPSGAINLVLRCGVLKPGSFDAHGYEAVKLCAAETGERVGSNCSRAEVNPGTNPLVVGALPKITAIAYPGLYNRAPNGLPLFTPFYLTAFRNPGTYNPFNSLGGLVNNQGGQVLNGTNPTRILLKSCMDKTVVVKLPVTGQVNAANQEEADLLAGDIIKVRIDIPKSNTVDVYCHEQSLKVMGIGEVPQLFLGN
jgi:hypothetical protein